MMLCRAELREKKIDYADSWYSFKILLSYEVMISEM